MKKFFLIIALATMLSSCEYVSSGYIPKEIGYEYEVNISEIEHEGHSYLLFDGYGVIHNPNCKCNKEED